MQWGGKGGSDQILKNMGKISQKGRKSGTIERREEKLGRTIGKVAPADSLPCGQAGYM